MKGPSPDMIREHVRKGHPYTLIARGQSLFPLIIPGSRLEIRWQEPFELKPGTLIVYERNGQLVCHLLQAVEGKGQSMVLRTQGLYAKDPPVPASMMVGVVGKVIIGPIELNTWRMSWVLWGLSLAPAVMAIQISRYLFSRLMHRRARE